MSMKDYLLVKDIVADLGLSTVTVIHFIRTGDLPGYRFGKSWRGDKADYAAWKESKKVKR